MMICLSSEQEKIVNCVKGPAIVFACAGSGKTSVLTYRIFNMVKMGIHPKNILAITFTNKATDEMKLRLYKVVGEKTKDITISTIHSFCARILREDVSFLGIKSNFNIIDEVESERILKKILKENDFVVDLSCKKMLLKFSGYKNKSGFLSDEEKKIFLVYNKILFDLNCLDYDDLLVYVLKLFKDFPDVLEKYQNRYLYVLVDEFQDVNFVQYEILKMLCFKHRNLFVVGDNNQSIYGFRGTDKNNIIKFKTDFYEYKEYSLFKNYRSSIGICEVSNKLINSKMTSEIIEENDFVYGSFETESQQNDFIINEIKQLKKIGVKNSEIAILYRSNVLSKNIELSLISNNLSYKIFGGFCYLKRMEVRDVLCFFRLFSDRNDIVSFLRIVNIPRKILTERNIDELIVLYKKYRDIEFSLMFITLDEFKREMLNHLFMMLRKYGHYVEEYDLSVVYEKFLVDFGYLDYLKSFEDFESRFQNLEYLKFLFNKIENEKIFLKASAIQFVLDEIFLSYNNFSVNSDSITLSTIHSAKGLEFDYVFLIGMEEEIFPNVRLAVDVDLEEERRICYVAMTRAKKRLYMTYSKKRLLYGKLRTFNRSRFLDEILVDR